MLSCIISLNQQVDLWVLNIKILHEVMNVNAILIVLLLLKTPMIQLCTTKLITYLRSIVESHINVFVLVVSDALISMFGSITNILPKRLLLQIRLCTTKREHSISHHSLFLVKNLMICRLFTAWCGVALCFITDIVL